MEKESRLLELCRYVVLNPVRAGLVKRIDQGEWSSYRATAFGGEVHHGYPRSGYSANLGRIRPELSAPIGDSFLNVLVSHLHGKS